MSTTRLTKQLRSEIASAVYKASSLPAELERLEALPPAKLKEILQASRPREFVYMIQGMPKEWFHAEQSVWGHQRYRNDSGEHLDTMYTDEIGKFANGGLTLDDPVLIPKKGCTDYTISIGQWMYEQYRPQYMAWAKRRDELNAATMGVLNSYRTVEKLLKDAPEFEQFIPKNSVAYPVPAVPISNALTVFMSAGIELKKAA